MKVREAMTPDPITIDPGASLGTAMEVMRSRRVRHLPVVDEAGRLMGIITDRDLRQAAFAPVLAERLDLRTQRLLQGLGRVLEDMRVRDAMTWGVITVHPDAGIVHGALLMFEQRVGSLPVIEDGKLVGVLTERDVLRALMIDPSLREFDPEAVPW
jgi:acetoin utilization protein AcuB